MGGSGDENLVDLRVDIALRSGWGVKLFSQEDLVEYTLPQEAFPPPETVWFYIWVDIPWWAPRATYRAEVTVRDLVSGEAVSLEREITVWSFHKSIVKRIQGRASKITADMLEV